MECPICGETLPLSSKVCESCGQEYDGFFLTEEFTSSSVRKSAAPQKAPRKQPSALKPSRRPPMTPKKIALIVGAAVALIAIAIAIVAFIPRGNQPPGTAQEAVVKYYEYLRKGNADGLFSLFESGYLPVAPDRAAIKAAMSSNKYTVSEPVTQILSRTENTALIAISNVEVDVAPKAGGAAQKKSLAAYIDSIPGGNKQMVSVVKLDNSGSGWHISGRPLGGWNPDNLWLLGELKNV